MKSKSTFGTPNRNMEELSYVQVNIYGTKLNDLRRKGVDVLKILKGLGVAECLMWEVPLPPACANRSTKLVGGSGSISGSARKSLRRPRPSVSRGSTRSSSDVSIKQEDEGEVGVPDQGKVRRLSEDLAREGGEDVSQESELLLNCSISTIHSCRTKAPGDGTVRLTRHPTVNSDCTEEAYPPLVSIAGTTDDVIPEDNNDEVAEKGQDDVEMRTAVALHDDTHLYDPNIDYLATPPLANDVIKTGTLDTEDVVGNGTDDVIMRAKSDDVITTVVGEVVEKRGAEKIGEDAELVTPAGSLPVKPCPQRAFPTGEEISSNECSAAQILSEHIVERCEKSDETVGDNRPSQPDEEGAAGSNSNACEDGNIEDEDGEFFDCSRGSFSDVADASMAVIRPIPVWPRQTCSLSGVACGASEMMESNDRRRRYSFQETQNYPDVISFSSLSEAVSRWTSSPFAPPILSFDLPQSRETVVPPLNLQGSMQDGDLNGAVTVGCDQPPPIEAANPTLNQYQSNLQEVVESDDNPKGFFYGGLYFDASFRSVVSHPSLIMEMDSPYNQETDVSHKSDESPPENGNSCEDNMTGREVDRSLKDDHFMDQPSETVTGSCTTSSMPNTSQPPVSQLPAADDLSIDRSGISIDSQELMIDGPRLLTPPPNLSVYERDSSIDGRDEMDVDVGNVSDVLGVEDNGSKRSGEQKTSEGQSGVRKRKSSHVSCDSSSRKNWTPRTSTVSDAEQFRCMYPGCRTKIHLRSRYGKDRLLNHVRLHWLKQSKKCPRCDFTAAFGRTVRRHFEQDHVTERWLGHVNLETREDVAELQKLFNTCFPNNSPVGEWPKEMRRILQRNPADTPQPARSIVADRSGNSR